jgi:hypothetical protein
LWLFRQPRRGDWSAVLERITGELRLRQDGAFVAVAGV